VVLWADVSDEEVGYGALGNLLARGGKVAGSARGGAWYGCAW
jgi:hypothetical protein